MGRRLVRCKKIFEALEEDTQNSGLGIICGELESQGYQVRINGRDVNADAFFNGELQDLENQIGLFNMEIYSDDRELQEFAIEFLDFHEIAIKKGSKS